MNTYWDSSALIELLHRPELRATLSAKNHFTRLHTLSELFSTLTKGVNFRYTPADAARMIDDLALDLSFVELSKDDALSALKAATRLGVRGGRIHDLMHATAARKAGAATLLTLDSAGFTGLANGLRITAP
jgi:predicted nucleic acid-binding protein